MAEVHGTFEDRFSGVQEALVASLDRGADVGASVAVMVDGKLVVDLWGGWADQAAGVAWGRDTITNVWSTTKTMAALCALILADRGELDVDAPVARYWPEFKAAGKEGVLVRNLLGHTSGLSGWQEPMRPEDLYDWEKATSLLAAQEPWWEPGTASGYHAFTQGYLVGEVVRRVTGQTIGAFFAAEVAGPLGADFHIGLDAAHDSRVSKVIAPPAAASSALDPSSVAMRTLRNPPLSAEQSWGTAWRRAEIPAAGGHGNARSVAAVQSVLACGGEVAGIRLLSAAGCDAALRQQSYGTDLVIGAPVRFGLGYGLMSAEMPISPNQRACFWGGWGGSLVIVDFDARMVVAYVMNKMQQGAVGDERGHALAAAAYAALAE
jgi:CubicO group peptidase (beta-lactamase class C family)